LDDKKSSSDNVMVLAAVAVETENLLSESETAVNLEEAQDAVARMDMPEIEEPIAPEATASNETVVISAASEDVAEKEEKKDDSTALVESSSPVVSLLEPTDPEMNNENDKPQSTLEETENGAEETNLPDTNDTAGDSIMKEEPTIKAA